MPRAKAFNQDDVLDKAKFLFWKKGFHATSMQDLVSTLGINRASLYDTFGNKNLLFEKALEKYKLEQIQQISDFLYHQINVRQGLHLLLENAIEVAIQGEQPKGCFVTNTASELANSNAAIKAMLTNYQASVETIYYNYLQYGINQGQISPYKDIKSIANYLYTLQSGLNVIAKTQADRSILIHTVNTALAVLD